MRIRRTAQQKRRPQLGFEPRTSHRLLMETTLSTNLRPLMGPRGSCRVQTSSKSGRQDYRLPFCLTREAYLGRSGKFTRVLARKSGSENQIQQNSVRQPCALQNQGRKLFEVHERRKCERGRTWSEVRSKLLEISSNLTPEIALSGSGHLCCPWDSSSYVLLLLPARIDPSKF